MTYRLRIALVLFMLLWLRGTSQELNCIVTVNDAEVGYSNRQIFETLENEIFEYMNNTKWTNLNYQVQQKINCSLTINILEVVSANSFRGTLQLKVTRPVYNSTYVTNILNFNDNDISFSYEEFQPMVYNENVFESNLLSLLTFYAYTILGYQADTFGYRGGEEYLRKAEQVMNVAQQGGAPGWNRIDGNFTRYRLNENLLSPVFDQYRKTMYEYHLLGLDRMAENSREAKEAMSKAITDLQKLYDERPRNFLIRVFFDTKSDEIVDVFADGPRVDTSRLREVLSTIYPSFDEMWKEIKI